MSECIKTYYDGFRFAVVKFISPESKYGKLLYANDEAYTGEGKLETTVGEYGEFQVKYFKNVERC